MDFFFLYQNHEPTTPCEKWGFSWIMIEISSTLTRCCVKFLLDVHGTIHHGIMGLWNSHHGSGKNSVEQRKEFVNHGTNISTESIGTSE